MISFDAGRKAVSLSRRSRFRFLFSARTPLLILGLARVSLLLVSVQCETVSSGQLLE